MPSFVRSVMAVLAGCIAAFFHIGAIEALGHLLYPPPPGLDPADRAALANYARSAPVGALLMVLLAYGVGTFAGSWFAARLAPSPRRNHGWAVGALFLIMTVANLALIPHPRWFWAACLATIPAASHLGASLGASRAETRPVETDRGGLES